MIAVEINFIPTWFVLLKPKLDMNTSCDLEFIKLNNFEDT